MVTGGCGFVGTALVRLTKSRRDYAILNVDKLTYAANLGSLKSMPGGQSYHFSKSDICDRLKIEELFQSFAPDAVLHMAAESHVDRSIDRPGAFIETNILGTYTLLEAAEHYWRQLPAARRDAFRFHHVSTDEVFGSADPEEAFTESTPYAPNSPYAASKASADMLVRAWHHTYGLPTLISNCSNNYGPYQFPEKFIPVVIASALIGRPIPIYGDGTNVRDWLHVEDHARALLAVLEKGASGESYNIGGGDGRTNIELATMVCRMLDDAQPNCSGKPYERSIIFVPDRPGHDLRYAIDFTKAESRLGWRPEVSLDKGLRQTVKWYVRNRAWWEPILKRNAGPVPDPGLHARPPS